MTFVQDNLQKFFAIYKEVEPAIRSFDGCRHAEVMPHIKNDGVIFTYSLWETEEHLERYRKSELFKSTWARVKPLFASKAEAWTLNQHV